MDCCDICIFPTTKCICLPYWKTFDNDLNQEYNFKNNPTKLEISTMTVNFQLKDCQINLDNIAKKFEKNLFTREINFKKNSKKSKKDLELNYNFYNQCTITSFIPKDFKLKELIKVSTKIFHNGSFTITGARSIQGIVHLIRKLLHLLISYGDVLILSGNLEIVNLKISLINTDFTINKKVKQKLLNEILQYPKFSFQQGGHIKSSIFDPDEYHAVKIKYIDNPEDKTTYYTRKGVEKYDTEVTISVFNTGSVIITGGKDIRVTLGAYQFINKVFDEFRDLIIRDTETKPKKKKKTYYSKEEIQKLYEENEMEEKQNQMEEKQNQMEEKQKSSKMPLLAEKV
jgi:TATA-box binding protein (TBP) (component of TFIID and TFIIIB)